jgi:beta-galactosidase
MTRVTRRDLLKSGAIAGALGTAPNVVVAATTQNRKAPPFSYPNASSRARLLLDFGWRFHLGHAEDPAKDFAFGLNQRTFAKAGRDVAAAAAVDFDDGDWSKIDLPHDWAVELPFAPSADFDSKLEEDPRAAHGFKPLGREYPETSIGWYRRVFDLPESDLGHRISIEFDGVFRDCTVIFNGYVVATNQSGYAPFRVDVTDFANYGGKNVLVLRVDASLGEGWFYEGAGIYRHVWLVKTDPLHIPQWGTWVRADVKGHAASLTLSTEVINDSVAAKHFKIISTVLDPDSRSVAVLASESLSLGPQEALSREQSVPLKNAALWSVETPVLYQLVTEIVADGLMVDSTATNFGIRDVRFDSERGLFVNGIPVKLKGTCNHQDHAGVGAALPDRLHDWRIARLKEMGSNAYRTSHNPPAPELIDACDRLGMLVIDETRRMSSDTESLEQFARLIRRDRNHPSVILWSIGNEEQGQQGTERGARIARTMKHLANKLDPSRQITAAMDHEWGKGITPVLDVVGFNYRTEQILPFHQQFPKQATMGTETGSTVSTRGIYVKNDSSGYLPAYDTEFPWWASTAESWWTIVAPRPFIAGGFVWTGFDYRGEPTPFNKWPNVSSQFGILDSCGFPKDNFYYYKAMWDDAPLLHLFPHWNWQGREGQTIKVWCHTNLERVELFLNGQSLGSRNVAPYSHVEWDVPFAPGALEARGYKGGAQLLVSRRETTDAPAQILLRADRTAIDANGDDMAIVAVEIVDAKGRLVPTAGDNIAFRISGPGRLIGVGNGDPRSHEPDKADSRTAFNGLCMAIVQSTRMPGQISLEATSTGLTSGSVTIEALPVEMRPFVT